jgi:hypothetical protein
MIRMLRRARPACLWTEEACSIQKIKIKCQLTVLHTFVNTCSFWVQKNILKKIITASSSNNMVEQKTQPPVKIILITTLILKITIFQRPLTFSHNFSKSLYLQRLQRIVNLMQLTTNIRKI